MEIVSLNAKGSESLPTHYFFTKKAHRKRGENVGRYRYLTLADREKLEALYLDGQRVQDIADTLGVHVATVYKELKRGDTGKLDRNMRQAYSAKLAQRHLAESLKNRGRRTEAETETKQTAVT